MTEKHLGNGRIVRFRDDEQVCVWERYGLAHPAHTWRYARTESTGDIVTGNYYCDGLSEADSGKPYPLPSFDVVERAKAIDTLFGLLHSLPLGHHDYAGVLRAARCCGASPRTAD